jgi:hypothetical protein
MWASTRVYHNQNSVQGIFPTLKCKAPPGFFLCIFRSITCLKKPVFIKGDLPLWKVPARLDWDLLTSGRYQPNCHYSKKWKKFSALLYIGKGPEYRPFHDF